MANSYLVETATPGGTMIRQGTDVAIGRLHSTFTSKLEATIRQARQEGIKASVYSAYRPPGYKVGDYANKRNSLHAYGLAVDFAGIGRPGSTTAKRFYDIAVANGLHNPYGPANAKEWNHFQLVPQKGRQFLAANPELAKTITDAGPIDLDKMWAASGIPVTGLSDPFGVGASKAPPASVGFGASTIRPGQKSDDVKALQTALIGMGAKISSPTGYYGPETRAAVEAFQKANGLKVDGVVGDDTKGMLGAAAYDSVTLEARDASAEAIKAQSAKLSAEVEAALAPRMSAPIKPVTRGPLPDLPPSVPRNPVRQASVGGVPLREPTKSELEFFRGRPDVGGYAAPDNRVVLNPYSRLSPQEKQSVAINEAARVQQRVLGSTPPEPTAAQQSKFAGYGSPQDIRETIAARIVANDPSAGRITMEQYAHAKQLAASMNYNMGDRSAQPAIPTPRMRAAGDPMSTPNHPAWDNPPPGYYAGSPSWSQPKPGEPGGMPLKDAQLQRAEAARMAAFNRRDMEQPAAMSPAARAEALRQEAIKRTANDPAFNSALLGNGLRGSREAMPSERYYSSPGNGLLDAAEARPSRRADLFGSGSPFEAPRLAGRADNSAPPHIGFETREQSDARIARNGLTPSAVQASFARQAPQRTVIGNPAGIDMAERRRFTPNQMLDSVESAAARRYAPQPPATLDSARNAAAMAASAAANAPTRQTAANMASARAGASAAGAGAVSGMSRPSQNFPTSAFDIMSYAPQKASPASARALGAAPGAGPITGAMMGGYNPLAAQSLGRVRPPPPEFYKAVNPLTSAPIPRMSPVAPGVPGAPVAATGAPVAQPPSMLSKIGAPLLSIAMASSPMGVLGGIARLAAGSLGNVNNPRGMGYNQATANRMASVADGALGRGDFINKKTMGLATYGSTTRNSDGSSATRGTTRSGTGYESRDGGREIDIGGRRYTTNRQGHYSLNVGRK